MRSLAVTQTSQAAGVPADGAIVADKVGVGGATSANASADGDDLVCGSISGAATGASIVSTTTGNGSIFFTDNAGYKNQGQIKYDHATDAMTVATNTAVALNISSTGAVTVNGRVGTNFGDSTSLGLEVTSAGHQRVKVHSTSTTGHAVAYDLETGNTGPVAHTGSLKLSGAGALSMQTAGSDRLTISSTGLGTFSNGITVEGTNDWSHISASDSQSLELSDDSQIQLADTEAGSMLMHIYDRGTGYGALVFAAHGGQPILLADPSGVFAVADTDNKYCVYKSSGSHDVFFKNRSGGSKNFCILVTAGVLDDF